MGCDVYGMLVTGLLVRHPDMYEEQPDRCACSERQTSGKCCVECGQPLDRTKLVEIDGYDEMKGTYRGLPLFDVGDSEAGQMVIGREDSPSIDAFEDADSMHMVDTIALSHHKELRMQLEDSPLFDAAKFGTWHAVRVSV